MSQSISKLVDNLPTSNVTVYMLRSLDFVVPGEWQNLVGFENTIRAVTGVTDKDLIEEIVVVTVADREADIYELFVLPRRSNCEFLIRAHHNRIAKGSADQPEVERLQQLMGQTPACGQLALELRRHPEREARTARADAALYYGGVATTSYSPRARKFRACEPTGDSSRGRAATARSGAG